MVIEIIIILSTVFLVGFLFGSMSTARHLANKLHMSLDEIIDVK
jgi:hypothetical protein